MSHTCVTKVLSALILSLRGFCTKCLGVMVIYFYYNYIMYGKYQYRTIHCSYCERVWAFLDHLILLLYQFRVQMDKTIMLYYYNIVVYFTSCMYISARAALLAAFISCIFKTAFCPLSSVVVIFKSGIVYA